MSKAVYLDYNATAPIRPVVLEAMTRALTIGGNASSVHAAGRAAKATIETAREQVAALIGVKPGSLTFTSGGAEANALALRSAVDAGYGRIIVGAIEHATLWEGAHAAGVSVQVAPVDARGVYDLEALSALLAEGPPALVCLMLANNETGVIQPIAEAAALVRAVDGWLHVDAVPAAGKVAIDFNVLGADSMTISAHKLGGPQGSGALAAGERSHIHRQIHGGGHEFGRRAGTENLAGIAGFGAAAVEAAAGMAALQLQAAWRDAFAERLKAAGAVVLGESAPRLVQTLCVATPDFSSSLQVMNLDLAGVMVSAGSACSSGKTKGSRVVERMGYPDLAACSMRVTGGWGTTEADWVRAGDAWLEAHARLSARRKAVA